MSATDKRRRNRVAAAIAAGCVLLAVAVTFSMGPAAMPGTSLPRVVTPRVAEAAPPAPATTPAVKARVAVRVAAKKAAPAPAPESATVPAPERTSQPPVVTTRKATPAAPTVNGGDDHETVAPVVREQVVGVGVQSLGTGVVRTRPTAGASSSSTQPRHDRASNGDRSHEGASHSREGK